MYMNLQLDLRRLIISFIVISIASFVLASAGWRYLRRNEIDALYQATNKYNLVPIERCLNEGVKFDQTDIDAVLVIAVKTGDMEAVSILLKQGASANAINLKSYCNANRVDFIKWNKAQSVLDLAEEPIKLDYIVSRTSNMPYNIARIMQSENYKNHLKRCKKIVELLRRAGAKE